MPMIKRRRKSHKKNRICLFATEKAVKHDQPIENINLGRASTKKIKNGQINIKTEVQAIEKSNFTEKSKLKSQSVQKSIQKVDKQQSIEESNVDIKKETSKTKTSTKTKERYELLFMLNFKQLCNYIHNKNVSV